MRKYCLAMIYPRQDDAQDVNKQQHSRPAGSQAGVMSLDQIAGIHLSQRETALYFRKHFRKAGADASESATVIEVETS